MSVSNKVKAVLAIHGKRQIEMATFFGMGKQSMSNKFRRDSWSASDLAKVARFTGCKLAFVMPDGQQIVIDDDDTGAETDAE